MIHWNKKLLYRILLTLLFVGSGGSQQTCTSTKAIANNCDCHFIGACDWTQSPPAPLANPAAAMPVGINTFAKDPTNPETTEICEGTQNTLAIFYECDLRIPLYSARVLTDADMKSTYSAAALRTGFRMSGHIPRQHQQRNGDYGPKAKNQIPCYESTVSKPAGTMYYETNWYSAALKYGPPPLTCKPTGSVKKLLTTIDKGHLIASNYGKSAQNARQTVRDTFYLTNIVPQFADMNRGSWVRNEQILLNWASSKCASTVASRRNGRLFVIVGVIPSTFGTFPERYFGFLGFSDFQGKSSKNPYASARSSYKSEYRINVPAVMWTAACCEFEELDTATNNWNQRYITKAFWGENKPFKQPVFNAQPIGTLFPTICAVTRSCPAAMPAINLFPNQPLCV